MQQQNETERVLLALAGIEGVARVSRGGSALPEDEALPCIIARKTQERGALSADDREYMTMLEYTVKVFARLVSQADELAGEASRVMEALGYRRVLSWEETDGKVHQRLFRFRRHI